MADVLELRRTAMQALRPPAKVNLPDWLEAELKLPAGVSAQPGKLRLTPFQRGIAEAIGDPSIPRVSVVKSVRQGYSTLLVGAVGHYAKNDPSPVILLLPTEADCRNFTTRVLEPVAEASPCLSRLFSDENIAGRNTMLSKRYPGGSLLITPSRSPGNLRAHNARVLLVDESEAMEITAEGNPTLLAEKRTLAYTDRKIVVGSTPTTEENSIILDLYANSDQRIFEVRCIDCSDYAEIRWKDIKFDPERIEDGVQWCCPKCGSFVDEMHKNAMVEAGRWRATKPEVTGHAGFRANALISPLANAAWPIIVKEFLVAKNDPDNLRVWQNTLLAEGWRDGGDVLDEDSLRSRAEPLGLEAIPESALILTCGIDMQDSWADWTIVGSGRGDTFILGNGQIHGRYDSNELWAEIDDLLKSTWQHPLGGRIGISAAFLDEGDGEHQPHVRAFCRPRFNRRVASSKGMAGFQRPPIERSAAKGVNLFIVGVDALKNTLFNRLQSGNSIRFSDDLSPRYFEELVSEVRVVRYVKGQPTRSFQRIPGRRAETLDSTILAIGARNLVNLNLDRREEELSSLAAPKKIPAVIRSTWLETGRI
ncbi:phage terminase large subunit family protein [Mesorhizobium sp. A623]